MMSRRAWVISLVGLCLAALMGLAGCAGTVATGGSSSSSSASDSSSANRQYMSSANTIVGELEDTLEKFSTAVAEDDLVSMKSTAKEAGSLIDQIGKLTPSDTLKPVHEEYVKGCDDLRSALNDYVDLYSDQAKSKLSESAYEERLEKIQKTYQSGIDHLEAGDKQAAAL